MATYTTNMNLKKPAGTENINISDLNGNFDIIDKYAIGKVAGSGSGNLSETLYNCTGTIVGHLKYRMDGNLLMLEGRLIIDNYTRTGANPGFTFYLPSSKKSKYTISSLDIGINGTSNSGKAVRFGECTRLHAVADGTQIQIQTTETIDNMNSADKAIFTIFPTFIEVK